jgi:hypothetical protein
MIFIMIVVTGLSVNLTASAAPAVTAQVCGSIESYTTVNTPVGTLCRVSASSVKVFKFVGITRASELDINALSTLTSVYGVDFIYVTLAVSPTNANSDFDHIVGLWVEDAPNTQNFLNAVLAANQ